MRLLLINYELPPLGGGAGHATYHTALELAHRGHEVDVLTSRYGDVPDYQEVDGVRIHRVRSLRRGIHKCGLSGAASFLGCAAPTLSKLVNRRKPDICHYYFSLPTGLLSIYSNGLRGVPYVVSLRGSDVPSYDQTKRYMRMLHWTLGGVNRRIWHRAGAVVALSESLREQAMETDPTVPIDVISNGIDVEKFSPPVEPRPARRPVRLVCVCRLVRRKGVEVLLQSMRLLRDADVTLEIIGSGELESHLKGRARELGVSDRVQFSGYVSQDALPERYRQADVFVLPSRAESFGMVLLEAMSCGLPVVATNCGGIPETVKDNENGLLVPPGDSAALADALRRMIDSPQMRTAFGDSNVRKVRSQYTWSKVAERYEEAYREVLRHPHARNGDGRLAG